MEWINIEDRLPNVSNDLLLVRTYDERYAEVNIFVGKYHEETETIETREDTIIEGNRTILIREKIITRKIIRIKCPLDDHFEECDFDIKLVTHWIKVPGDFK